METLLPSEVARLVLGYLEEEKCVDAAKCFLNSSSDLSEIRIIAQKGKKYPTKVNGYSLKEVLEEYSLVHSIVQDSMCNMAEQPGGSMIDCLRLLVRACQPVQVHINLHPQQGQGLSTSKSENSDTASAPSRVRSKKISFSQGQSIENVDPASTSQSVLSQILPDSSSQKLGPLSIADPLPDQHQQPSHLSSVPERQNQFLNQNLNLNVQLSTSPLVPPASHNEGGLLPPTDQHEHCEVNGASHQNTFQSTNFDTYQEPPLQVVNQSQLSLPGNSQQMHLPAVNSNETVSQTSSAEFVPQSQESTSILRAESVVTQGDQSKPEEPVRSYTVTKCFGSNIVILESDLTQSRLPTGDFLNNSNIQDNEGNESQDHKLETPSKSNIPKPYVFNVQEISQKIIDNETMVTKLVENINRVWTPAKQPKESESQPIDEVTQDLDETVHSILKVTTEDPCFDQFLREFLQFGEVSHSSEETAEDEATSPKGQKKKKRVKKKPNCAGGAEGISPSKLALEKVGVGGGQGATTEGATPAKKIVEPNVDTPFSKFLKSMTSPSGENYMDPVQFAGLIDVSGSTTTTSKQSQPFVSGAPFQEQQPQPFSVDDGPYIMQQPNGLTMISCSSQQQKDQFLNENGVRTFCELIAVPACPAGQYVPIVPKILPGDTFPPETPQTSKPKKKPRPKRCLTRGGRKSGGQMHSDADQKNTVTLYGTNGKDEVSSTVPYSVSSDLPILVSDASDEVVEVQELNTNIVESDLKKSGDEKTGDSGSTESASLVVLLPEDSVTHLAQPELSTIPEEKEVQSSAKEDDNLPSLNASVIRNTPGLSGPSRANTKRLSFSTPRRPSSHIRALDFNTPPKENDQSVRRANTSPKNMSTNAISPRTAGKSIKSSVREGLFKPPSDGSRRTSKVKTHLFKSPEYALSSSSGYKIPSSAVTSTPAEGGPSVVESLVPQPSAAWDKVGGVSLILDPDVSPVVRKEPACRKNLRSWDSDLRSALGSIEPPAPPASRKRKINPPTEKPRSKKLKKTQESKESHEKEASSKANMDETLDKTRDISNESESEMAKLIEDNLMNTSIELASPVKKGNSSKSGVDQSPLKAAPLGKNGSVDGNMKEVVEEKSEGSGPSGDGLECTNVPVVSSTPNIDPPECEDKMTKQSFNSDESEKLSKENPVTSNCAVSADQEKSSTADTSEITSDRHKDMLSKGKVKTPVLDPSAISGADRIRLNLATLRESFTFDTPVKNNLCNVIPQTPRFLDPSSAPKDDTPRTKIIKAMTVPFPPGDSFVGTPTPGVPPTPTIPTTPSVSPNCPAYFQPSQSSSLASVSKENDRSVKSDNLENILIQECSRIEAGGMREAVKKLRKESPESPSDVEVLECSPEEQDDAAEGLTVNEQTSEEKLSDNNGQEESDKDNSPTVSSSPEREFECARSIVYQRKRASVDTLKKVITNVWPGAAKKKSPISGDESEDCLIVSPKKSSSKPANENCDNMEKACEEVVQKTASISSGTNPEKPEEPLIPASIQAVTQMKTVNIEDALDHIHGKKTPSRRLKSPTKSTQSPRKLPLCTVLTSSEQNQTVVKASVDVGNLNSLTKDGSAKHTWSTPEKEKISATRSRTPSSKKKPALVKNATQEATDDESSDSSYSESSSDSDSNTSSSSSSSSSEEGTPVKENISPTKQNTPVKTKTRPSADKGQQKSTVSSGTDAAVNSEDLLSIQSTGDKVEESKPCSERKGSVEEQVEKSSAESVKLDAAVNSEDLLSIQSTGDKVEERKPCSERKGSVEEQVEKSSAESVKLDAAVNSEDLLSIQSTGDKVEESTPCTERKGSVEQQVEKSSAESVKLDLKSVIETKDMGSCEKIAKTRSAHNSGGSDILSELHEKRKRTLEQLKKGPPTRRVVKQLKENRSVPDENVNQIVPDSEENKDNQPTKDTEEPKKRRSKSETDKITTGEEAKDSSTRPRSASDSARISDDDEEFRLRLSGDEKEDSPPKSLREPHDIVEIQIAALHGHDAKSQKSNIIGTPIPLCPDAKIQLNMNAPEISVQSMKIAPKNVVSSKASDDLIKVLMEKGFGVSMPPLPTQKIKKVDPNKVESNVKSSVGSKANLKSTEKVESVSSQNSSTRSVEKSSNEESLDADGTGDFDSNEVGYEEVINTSAGNTHEVLLTYKGLGVGRAKKNIPINNNQTFDCVDFKISLAPTSFIHLYDSTSKTILAGRSRRSDFRRTESKSQKADGNRLSHGCWDGRESRRRLPRDKSPRDRSSRHHSGSRSRRNRTPSPRTRHGRDFSHDRDYSRDARRRKDYHNQPRSDHYSRKQETYSSNSRKYPDTDPRSADSSSSKTKSIVKEVIESKSAGSKISKMKSVSKESAEEGELLSSDSDFEPKSSSQRKRASSPPRSSRCTKGRTDKVVPEKDTRGFQQANTSFLVKTVPLTGPYRVVRRSPKRRMEAQKDTLNNVPDSTTAESKAGNAQRSKDCPLEEEINDTDLDGMDFPMLGDDDVDENDPKATDHNSPHDTDQKGAITRRRAPPRSVNAHKASVSENKTPVQRGKRKLTISPDVASEDSCQSSSTPANPDKKQIRLSRRSKKPASLISTPASTIPNPTNETEDVADPSEIIKNLDVESFLTKVHG